MRSANAYTVAWMRMKRSLNSSLVGKPAQLMMLTKMMKKKRKTPKMMRVRKEVDRVKETKVRKRKEQSLPTLVAQRKDRLRMTKATFMSASMLSTPNERSAKKNSTKQTSTKGSTRSESRCTITSSRSCSSRLAVGTCKAHWPCMSKTRRRGSRSMLSSLWLNRKQR